MSNVKRNYEIETADIALLFLALEKAHRLHQEDCVAPTCGVPVCATCDSMQCLMSMLADANSLALKGIEVTFHCPADESQAEKQEGAA